MTPEHIREDAKQTRERARFMVDPFNKVQLHKIADELEKAADDLEQHVNQLLGRR